MLRLQDREAKLTITVAPSAFRSSDCPVFSLTAAIPSSIHRHRAFQVGLPPAVSYCLAAKRRARATSEAVYASRLLDNDSCAITGNSAVSRITQPVAGGVTYMPPTQVQTPVSISSRSRTNEGTSSGAPPFSHHQHHQANQHRRRSQGNQIQGAQGIQPTTRSSPNPHGVHRQARHESVSYSQSSPLQGQLPQSQSQSQPKLPPSSHEPTRPGSSFEGSYPRQAIRRWRLRTPKQLTSMLYSSTSLHYLLAQLEVCGPLTAIQLCAALTTAERIASGGAVSHHRVRHHRRGIALGGPGDGYSATPQQLRVSMGLLAPPCRSLTHEESSALIAVLEAHSEVLADADPPELAATLWAAARLRLKLPPATFEPALEAIWLWDPADPIANRQKDQSNHKPTSGGADIEHHRCATREVMGPWEVCLLLYAVSVLWPEYVRQNAGGFLEALDSYETVGQGWRSKGSSLRYDSGGSRRGGLSCEQVVGVVASLSRADASLDEVEEEFVLQAVASRLSAFSLPQLTALLSAAQKWAPLRRALHGSLLAALLSRLGQHHDRFMTARRELREATQRTTAVLQAPPQERHSPLHDEQQMQPQQQHDAGEGSTNIIVHGKAAADGEDVHNDSVAVARALVTALRSGLDPTTGQPLPSRILSTLMRQVRLRATAFSARDVCEALRAMASLHSSPAMQSGWVIRWKEGVRGLLRRWMELLHEMAEVKVGTDGLQADADVAAGSAAARTFATTLHAVAQLGIRLQPAESVAAAAAAAVLAPHMAHIADCVMVLSAMLAVLVPETLPERQYNGVESRTVGEVEVHPEVPLTREPGYKSAEVTEDTDGDIWLWLEGSGVRRLGAPGRRAAQLVLERAAVLLRQEAARGRGSDGQWQGADAGGSSAPPAGEVACLIRAAASMGAWPPEWWWRVWCDSAVAALPPALRLPMAAPTAATTNPVMLSAPRATAAVYFSLTESVDVLYSLARLTHIRMPPARKGAAVKPSTVLLGCRRRWRWRRQLLETSSHCREGGPEGASLPGPGPGSDGRLVRVAANEAKVSPLAPLDRQLLTALLAVACLGPIQPRRTMATAQAITVAGGADSVAGPIGGVGVMSVYYLAWAVARLRLFAPEEAALWVPRLTAAAPRVLMRLTPRKQVLMLRALTRVFHGLRHAVSPAGVAAEPPPLPPSVAAAWLAAFEASMGRARGQTLSYAAAAMAAARISPPEPWLTRFRSAVRGRVSELGVREIAALVAGLRLHRRQPPQPRHQLQPQLPQWGLLGRRYPDADEWGNAGLARALLRVLRRRLAAATCTMSPARPSRVEGRDLNLVVNAAGEEMPCPQGLRSQRWWQQGRQEEQEQEQNEESAQAAKLDTDGLAPGPSAIRTQSQLSDSDRQLARRLCFLLIRGAAATERTTAGAKGGDLPRQEQQLSGPQEEARQTLYMELDRRAAGGRNGSRHSSRSGNDDCSRRGGSGGGGLGSVPLAPRPLVVIRRGSREERGVFRLP